MLIDNFLIVANIFSNPMIPMLVFMFVIMYFMMIRPQKKRQQEQDRLKASLKAGDKIITIGGVHGVIESVKKDTIRIVSAEKTLLEFSLDSVMKRVSESDEQSKK